uniref:Uncharacterized protein n=1 Tax=Arundo donax TaxID=35708 RepID=A0A0A9ATV0_ARUDO
MALEFQSQVKSCNRVQYLIYVTLSNITIVQM